MAAALAEPMSQLEIGGLIVCGLTVDVMVGRVMAGIPDEEMDVPDIRFGMEEGTLEGGTTGGTFGGVWLSGVSGGVCGVEADVGV